eukprot:6497341-Karenia_brevis.AAC.1
MKAMTRKSYPTYSHNAPQMSNGNADAKDPVAGKDLALLLLTAPYLMTLRALVGVACLGWAL